MQIGDLTIFDFSSAAEYEVPYDNAWHQCSG